MYVVPASTTPPPTLKSCTTPSWVESADCVRTTETCTHYSRWDGRNKAGREKKTLGSFYGAQSDQVNLCNPWGLNLSKVEAHLVRGPEGLGLLESVTQLASQASRTSQPEQWIRFTHLTKTPVRQRSFFFPWLLLCSREKMSWCINPLLSFR